jgi:hypothetical protein
LNSSALSVRSNTATPPIHPVKPTPRLLWMTRPMVKGPPLLLVEARDGFGVGGIVGKVAQLMRIGVVIERRGSKEAQAE